MVIVRGPPPVDAVYYVAAPDASSAQQVKGHLYCSVCRQRIVAARTVEDGHERGRQFGHIKSHFHDKHPDDFVARGWKINKRTRAPSSKVAVQPLSTKVSTQTRMGDYALFAKNSSGWKRCLEDITRLLVMTSTAFSFVESPYFKTFMESAQARFVDISESTVRREIKLLGDNMRARVLQQLQSATYISYSFDTTTVQSRRFGTLTVLHRIIFCLFEFNNLSA